MSNIKIYIGCPEDDLSNDYLCMDINLSDGTEIPVKASESLGFMSELDFIELLEEYCNRANYLSSELSLPVTIDRESLIIACQDNFNESAIKAVTELIRELRTTNKLQKAKGN